MKRALPLLVLLLAGCGGGGGGGNNPIQNQPPPMPSASWQAFYSSGVSRCDDFEFPQQDGIHYCVKNIRASVGQTISMTFTVSGNGTLMPVQTNDIPPAALSLFIWRAGDPLSCIGQYQQYRFWGQPHINLVNGTQTLSVPLTPDRWTDCFGQSGSANPQAFADALNNSAGLGYTFGGQYFAGHGVMVVNGSAHFTLNSFTIDGNQMARRKKRRHR